MAAIEPTLVGGADHLGPAFSSFDGEYHYVGAHIYDAAGVRISSGDVWVFSGSTPYALSGSAREFSSLGDGRDLPGAPSAGDDPALALIDCTIAAGDPG